VCVNAKNQFFAIIALMKKKMMRLFLRAISAIQFFAVDVRDTFVRKGIHPIASMNFAVSANVIRNFRGSIVTATSFAVHLVSILIE